MYWEKVDVLLSDLESQPAKSTGHEADVNAESCLG